MVQVIAYDERGLVEHGPEALAKLAELLERWRVVWVNVDGLGDTQLVTQLGQALGLHGLALEDAVNTHQRPKFDAYDDHLFVIARMATLVRDQLDTEQLALCVGRGFVVTFQEGKPGDCLDPVRDRLRRSAGRVRSEGADYLAYALLDAVVDHYFPLLESLGEKLDELEQRIVSRAPESTPSDIVRLKHDLLIFRRALWPLREALSNISRESGPFIADTTRPYLRDCYDHVIQLVDVLEIYRELASTLMDVYLSTVSNRMNEVMKVLTVIATIFIPLTFVAGVYGMNFDPAASPWNMPELHWHYGYPLSLLLMAAIAVGLLWYFRRRGWLGGAPPRREDD